MRGEANGEEERRQGQEHEEEEEEEAEEHPVEGARRQRQTSARPSSGLQQQPRPAPTIRNVGYVGKHRLSAAITRLDQELQSLQNELDELESIKPASASCQEVITSTEGKPDPLLPVTSGPEDSSWDRWFQRVRTRSNKWWASRSSDFS